VFLRASGFRLPNKHSTPIIMIGPGTGLAPFRAFIQERAFHRQKSLPVSPSPSPHLLAPDVPVGDTVLYFGCQKKAEHYLYEAELEEYHKNGDLTELNVAFSRDQVRCCNDDIDHGLMMS
jgi:NADPH-ferrihemoprotein reductase